VTFGARPWNGSVTELGPVLGTLAAGLVIGQFGITIPPSVTNLFFLFFVFALGFRTGPEDQAP